MKEQVINSVSNREVSTSVLESLANVFSTLLGEEVSAMQSFHILHVMLSFVVLICSGSLPVLAQVMLLVWFCAAGYSLCKSMP